MKILVTGANGYVGQGIVRQLLDDGLDVVASDIRVDKIDSRATKIEANIFHIENPYDFFGNPDILLHLAWQDGFIHNSSTHIDQLSSHFHFILKMAEKGIKKICIMGTMHEVGFYEGCISDNTPTNPYSYYGIAKNALQKVTTLVCKERSINYQWLRGFYIVANTTAGNSIFSKITIAEKEGQTLFPFTSGIKQFDFLDYDDFCLQVASAVEQDFIDGIINICSGYPQKLSDRVERFIKDNGFHIRLDYGKYPDRPYDSNAVWGDNTKILRIMHNRKKSV